MINEDPEMCQLKSYIEQGWPQEIKEVEPSLRNYFKWREELTIEDDVLFKGNKVIIPQKLRKKMLQDIHQSHIGI